MSEGGAPAAGRGRRERTKAANRAAILRAAREVFGEIGYGAASVRDIVRRTDLATGTFYNYFPDKESVLHALVDELAGEARRRVRAARRAAGSRPTARSAPRTNGRASPPPGRPAAAPTPSPRCGRAP